MTGVEFVLAAAGIVHIARVVGQALAGRLDERRTDRLAR